MKTRKLGRHGPEVSALSFGAMSFGGFYGPTDRDESFATLDALVEMGIDFLDTSNIYGPYTSEETIGAWQATAATTRPSGSRSGTATENIPAVVP